MLDFRTVLVTFVGRNDEIVSIRCAVVKSGRNALMRQTPKSYTEDMSRDAFQHAEGIRTIIRLQVNDRYEVT
ncbi:BZ3500_MvSof-1268-A1-R1_Chr2-3g05355 [Microbotryum saponariae]|uniref:BZ3500_MvSof-1268-A1-R1_Chr2-3g05355 protein n=1 Tax=Microbotryum saponariae TaxID=289078 RepID=A0A2X0K6Z4_9BASI|nr:BZ3500_MvSof-1268-A1-R1_Chr2-3g05355 [Microbotryum saponariae]SDA01262.1 BZ3501_MvSof-1269-A2-R1_Chr2-2g05028 [Microbotryum saponariae]